MKMDFSEYKFTTSIGFVILLVIIYTFANYYNSLNNSLKIIKDNRIGIERLNTLLNISFLTQDKRDLEYISTLFENRDEFYSEIKDSDKSLSRELSNIELNEAKEFYNILFQIEKFEQFKEREELYDDIASLLTRTTLDSADRYSLFIEQERSVHTLISILVYRVPELIYIIGDLRTLGSKEIIKSEKRDYLTIEAHLERLHNIREMLNNHFYKLDERYYNQLYNSNSELQSSLKKIEKSTFALLNGDTSSNDYNGYFLELSRTLQLLKSYSFISVTSIGDSIKDRERELEEYIIDISLLFALLVLSILFTLYKMVKQLLIYNKDEKSIREREDFIKDFSEQISLVTSSKELAREGVSLVAKRFNSLNAILYICSKKNKKLYLGATYGILPNDVQNTVEPSEGLIGETRDNIDIRSVTRVISAGVLNIETKYLVTAPLKYTDQTIGVIQFSTIKSDKPSESELQLLKELLVVLSSYLFKLQNQENTARYLKLVDNHVITSSTNLEGIISSVSKAFVDISGYSKHELLGHNHNIVRHEDMDSSIFEEMWDTISNGDIWSGEIKNRKKSGGFYWVKVTISPDFDFFNNIIGYTAIRQDITDKKRIEEISVKDGLTGLYNRRHFDDMFYRQINIGKRNKKLLVFMIMDIDNFKKYNDTYGHQAGDTALQRVSNTLKRTFNRSDDYVFRLGGEEFAVLLFADTVAIGKHLADRLRQRVSSLGIEHSQNSDKGVVTISIGIYNKFPDDISSVDEIYRDADRALYQAKESGRDTVAVYHKE